MAARSPRDMTIAVTGANAGIGFFSAARFAAEGARVVLLCRDLGRAQSATRAIRARVPGARLDVIRLDTSSHASVVEAGQELAELDGLDVLVNNAGAVHAPRERTATEDGHELILSTNVLGPVALTAHAMPALRRSPAGRVVWLGSLSTLLAPFRLDDLELVDNYSAWQAYAQSKIALSSIGFELNRRLVRDGSSVRSLVAHPGYSIGGRTPRVPGVNEPTRIKRFGDNLIAWFTQGKDAGSDPVVRAALDGLAQPDLDAGIPVFYGPDAITKGRAVRARPATVTTDERIAGQLWSALGRLTELPETSAR
ncbi:SDR family NAD(P)-dependent oxidoreductase [Mycetocola reblochoni]|uniref:SDR family NAD(P)-dependent oxidoreductase n=2 Tax=Mycetocola reblochoni TaxID=331618 RepID=A0A3L6ZIQ6_9MICO|nr:SDR family NAD(P)-dependent oxidoreductase [Mycetocola reblochoni]RLP67919.1 SDR family NAD(P)-dependent oxidoreductase [Mycetocola reblochoni]SJN21145.1 probable oxidoreductase/Short-chain dehydrogenase [Mycetocola reblochoni REB411]